MNKKDVHQQKEISLRKGILERAVARVNFLQELDRGDGGQDFDIELELVKAEENVQRAKSRLKFIQNPPKPPSREEWLRKTIKKIDDNKGAMFDREGLELRSRFEKQLAKLERGT